MSNLSDDDVAATRIHHADGSSSGATPVTAPATTWMILINSTSIVIPDSGASALRDQLRTLCSPP